MRVLEGAARACGRLMGHITPFGDSLKVGLRLSVPVSKSDNVGVF